MLRHLPPVTQGVALVYLNEEYRIYIPTGPEQPPIDGALLDAELEAVGLELHPDWEEDWNLVEFNGQLMSEVTVKRMAGQASGLTLIAGAGVA